MKIILAFMLTATLALTLDLGLIEIQGSHAVLAKKKKSGKAKSSGSRKRVVVKETKVKMNKRDRTKVDFDEATLEGRRLNPSGVSLNLRKPNREFDLIKLRRHWKPEMVSSTSSVENR